MKIAICNGLDYHFECIGFLLEIYNNNNNEIDIYLKTKNQDKYKWIEYYSSLFKFDVKYNNFSEDIVNNYDKIFKVTSDDRCINHKSIISILHLNKMKIGCKSEKFISFTPYIKGNNIKYIFPIYQPELSNNKISKIVTMLGYYTNRSIDRDTINFIKNNGNYHFNLIVWGSSSYPNVNNVKNVTVYSKIETKKMIDIVKNSKYILSKKHINYDRFSGQLSIAMSYEKPMIIDIKTKNAYKLPGIAFKKNYSEIGKLDDITEDKYQCLKNEIKTLKDKMLNENKNEPIF